MAHPATRQRSISDRQEHLPCLAPRCSSARRVLGAILALLVAAVGVVTLVASPAAAADHVVRPGENLSTIARRYGVSVAELTRLNRLTNPNHLLVGTRLHLPETSNAAASGATSSAAGRTGATTARSKAAPHGPAKAERAPAFTLTEPQRVQIAGLLERAAHEFAVPPDLLKALTYTESRWSQDATSRIGAIGVGQLLPDTASWLAAMMGEPGLNLRSPDDNIRMSARLLRYLLDVTGSTRTALASYYQGIGAVLRTGVSTGGARYATIIASRRSWFA